MVFEVGAVVFIDVNSWGGMGCAGDRDGYIPLPRKRKEIGARR